jgi:replicative DNA helicase
MSDDLEGKAISAVLGDRQIHVLLQANPDALFKTHKDIWDFVRSYYEQNMTMPPLELVSDKFRDFVPETGVGSTKHHLEELRAYQLEINLKEALRTAAALLQSHQPLDALNTIIAATSDLKRTTADVRDINVVDVDDAVAYFKMIEEMAALGSHGIKTGLAGFDNYLPSGIMPGMFGILLAYPGIGKSWLALFMAVQAWLHGKVPLIVSLEMTESEVRNRVYTIMAQGLFSHRKLSAGEVDIEEFQRWGEKFMAGKPAFHIISNDGMGEVSPAVLRAKIDQYAPDIVFVDYIQLMQPNTPTDNEVVKIKNISRELKILAISENVPVVAIASATPDDATNMTTVPTLGQVAWSKQLAYDADWVLALGRPPTSDVLEVAFRKNRNGFLGDFYIQTDFDSGRFTYKDAE